MKTTTVLAIALGLGSLAACNKSPKEQVADNIEANADNTADMMEANVDNAADAMQANTENAADAVRNVGDNQADAVRNADNNATKAHNHPVRSHAGGSFKGAPSGAPFSHPSRSSVESPRAPPERHGARRPLRR